MGIGISQSNVPTSVVDEAITKEMHDGLGRATTTASSLEAEQGSGNISKTQTKATSFGPSSPRTSSEGGLGEGNTSQSREGNMQLLKLMDICTKLSHKVTTLENELTSTKVVYNTALITLTKRVKKLEKKLKHKRRRALLDSSKDEKSSLDHEDSPKQGRMIKEIDEDENVNLVQRSKEGEAHETTEHRMDLSIASQTDDDETLAETLLNIKRSTTKDKGKSIMQESEPPKKIKKKEIMQKNQQNQAQAEQWDNVQAHIQADKDLAQRMLEEERESLSIEERSRLLTEFIDKRKKMLAVKRAEEKRNKPPTQAQQRAYMSNYIKNIGGYTLKQLKQYSFEEIKMLFDNTMESIRKFVPMESEGQVADSKAGEGSSKEGESLKRPAEEELGQEQEDEEDIV
uniref:Uncharacterized protein n=1 Tax=Tanacetum cinerariifolium TaxID=118510 RepID=A0A6L2MJT1_TANCI|nr:hypothetical protein [Tanacetum cinerariifolium]